MSDSSKLLKYAKLGAVAVAATTATQASASCNDYSDIHSAAISGDLLFKYDVLIRQGRPAEKLQVRTPNGTITPAEAISYVNKLAGGEDAGSVLPAIGNDICSGSYIVEYGSEA